MRDDSDRTAFKIFIVLAILATLAWKISSLYEKCADMCVSQGQTFVDLKLNNIMSGTCICVDR